MKSCYLLTATLAFSLGTLGCSKKKDDDDSDSVEEILQANTLAIAYPTSLAISVFPQTGTSLRLADEVEDPNAKKTVSAKVEENKKVLKGEADTCINKNLFGTIKGLPTVTCYEFDSDMNPSKFSGQTQEYGTKDGTDGKGEACLVAFTRAEVQEAVNTVDRALAMVAGLLCQAKKDKLATEQPAVGAKQDLSESFGKATDGFMNVETAEISRLEDIENNPVFRTDIVTTDKNGKKLEVHLVHSPGSDGTNSGTLWFLKEGKADDKNQNDPNNSVNKNDVMSINYSRVKDGDTFRMRYEVRRASIIKTVEPFTDEGLVNYDGVPDDAQNDKIHAINYVAFDINPETNAGSLSYWQNPGGNYNESARGFLFDVTADSDGKLSGCGVSGATANVSIRKALKEPSEDNTLAPVRYWHPRGDQNIHPDKDDRFTAKEGFSVTKQCFSQNADGIYAIDTAKTTHSRGYEVIEKEAVDVKPPKAPKKPLEGDFKP